MLDKIIFSILIILLMSLNIIMFIENDKQVMIAPFVISFFIIILFWGYRYALRRDVEKSMSELSDLLELLIAEEDDEISCVNSETLNSKLQFQVVKLISILKNKNIEIENDKNEIKELVSDIAHQLKTPIATLQMYNDLLKDNSLSELEREEFEDIMSLTIDKLSFLIENLIKMSRIESGIIILDKKENHLNEVVLIAIKNLQGLARVKNIEIVYTEKDDTILMYDKKWLGEAVYNILENAIKYSFDSTVIEVRIESYDLFSRITIINSGIGIKEEDYPKIFKRFYRGVQNSEVEGLGLGLYISSNIVETHGGYIKVDSKNGYTSFSVFLPNEKLN